MSERSLFFKSKATEKTMKWLEANYELCEGVCLPRCLLYSHYLEFCRTSEMNPISAAAFGKIIRRRFHDITTRRLGTRGQSKYHYFGLSIKKSSSYYHEFLQRYHHLKGKPNRINSLRRRARTEPRSMNIARKVLANFPRRETFSKSDIMNQDLENFLYKYKIHCDDLTVSIVHNRVDEVPSLLNRFWLFEIHLLIFDRTFFDSTFTIKVINFCDSLFYDAILSAIIPLNVKDITPSCLEMMKILGNEYDNWLHTALIEMPLDILEHKIKGSQIFTRTLKRYCTLLPLVKNCASLLNQVELLTVMVSDLKTLDLDLVMDDLPLEAAPKLNHCLRECFIDLLLDIDHYTDISKFFATLSNNLAHFITKCKASCVISKSTRFILIVNRLIVCLGRELTLNNVTTMSHWITLLSAIREYSLLVAEDTIRKDAFTFNKILLFQVAEQCNDLPELDFCSFDNYCY
ncbi:DNA-binding protein RFX6-like [Brevipalpus obovatus]|uniref:DNA-binding protein RFX6-like n=1 Tax=Brevipalpus obovatus TaxID=246614 RepID=UPI003D9ED9B1